MLARCCQISQNGHVTSLELEDYVQINHAPLEKAQIEQEEYIGIKHLKS